MPGGHYFVTGPGGSPVDPVWRAGVRAELAVSDGGKSVASLFWDIIKFYGHFSHAELACECKQLDFDIALVRVALVHLLRGTSLWGVLYVLGFRRVRGFLLAVPLRRLSSRFARPLGVTAWSYFSAWSGLICLSTVGKLPWMEGDQVVSQLVQAAELMEDQIQYRLGCSVSADKAAVAASSNQLARKLEASGGMAPWLSITWAMIFRRGGAGRSERTVLRGRRGSLPSAGGPRDSGS